jgi:16S rRNA (uracil1498-N3)-methyltransferase
LAQLSTIEQAAKHAAELKLLLDQHGKPLAGLLQNLPKTTLAFVGPEGGFTDGEKQLLQKTGCVAASLGSSILRIETAAMAMAAAHNLFK